MMFISNWNPKVGLLLDLPSKERMKMLISGSEEVEKDWVERGMLLFVV